MTLPTQLDLPMDAIKAYCEKWGIQEFALFGSILRPDFHEDSDVDVMVTFDETARPTLFSLVRMTDELEALFGREVDLVDRQAVEASPNYIRRKEVLGTAEVIYGAKR